MRNPTVEVFLWTEKVFVSAIVPSGASTGVHEAVELRDGDVKRFGGKGVLKACSNVEKLIAPELMGMEVVDNQEAIDKKMIELDGTENKGRLGANAILGVSIACAKAAAEEKGVLLFEYFNPDATLMPVPGMNIMNGGKHADSGFDIQEFMIMPVGAPNITEGVRMGAEVFHTLGGLLKESGYRTTVGDEGGYAPSLKHQEQALDFILKAVEKAGYKAGEDIVIALDAAASEFYSDGFYNMRINGVREKLNSDDMIDYWDNLTKKYPIMMVEDGLDEDDWDGWVRLNERIGGRVQLVGDDFLVTNVKRLKKAIDMKACNAILIKMNQIGSMSETFETINTAKKAGWENMVSHRSGETEDVTLAHLTVGMETGELKTGSLSRTERVAKYNELMRIERHLGNKARYLGKHIFDYLK